jgi:hypothetical protein
MQTDTYFRLVDLTGRRPREIGLWHFAPSRP